MLTATRREWNELYVFFTLLAQGELALGDADGKRSGKVLPVAMVSRQEHDGPRQYVVRKDEIRVKGEHMDECFPREDFAFVADLLLKALSQCHEQEVEAPAGVEEFLDALRIYDMEARTDDRTDFYITFCDEAFPRMGFRIYSRLCGMDLLLDGGRTSNLKFEQTGARFSQPTVSKINFTDQPDNVADVGRRMMYIESLGGMLKYSDVADKILANPQKTDAEIDAQRDNVKELRAKLAAIDTKEAQELNNLADYLIKKSVWILGGDGWAYDIGFGGLDHAIASGKNINILVMDTGVYSNTGGQQSKATPMGASAKFATAGKALPKKDLAMIAMSYGNVYVAQVSMGANDMQVIKAMNEAEAFDGPSIIIAYSHCIAQGFNLADGLEHQKLAVETGSWPLYRYNPDNIAEGKAPLVLDSKAQTKPLADYMSSETRFQIVKKANPERYENLMSKSEENLKNKRDLLEHMAEFKGQE